MVSDEPDAGNAIPPARPAPRRGCAAHFAAEVLANCYNDQEAVACVRAHGCTKLTRGGLPRRATRESTGVFQIGLLWLVRSCNAHPQRSVS